MISFGSMDMKSLYISYIFQIKEADFQNFDFIFGMDEENMKELKRRAPKTSKAQLLLLGDFDPEGERIIRDPYYVSYVHFMENSLLIYISLTRRTYCENWQA